MEAEIISKEFIKPSSPTPEDKKTYTLTLLDQIVPPIYAPIVLYYPNNHKSPESISRSLKQSLSTTLSHFYPLAGRLKDSLSIHCNDQGLLFVVAKFGYPLSDFLKNPDSDATRTHIPTLLTWDEPGPGSQVAMVQLNHFHCGGIAVAALFLHKVTDGAGMATIMKSWAAASRGSAEPEVPDYSARPLFPNNASMKRESSIFSAMKRYFGFGKTVMRRYVFDAAAISKLREELTGAECLKLERRRPSRVETVSAFLWKCFMVASAAGNGGRSVSLVTHGVNMRRKVEPPLPENSFGNYVWLVPAVSSNGESDRDLKALFEKVREGLSRVDLDFVKRMEGEDGFAGYCTNFDETWNVFVDNADYLSIVSWCNFDLYGVDFGLGRPIWISKCDGGSDVECPFLNMLWLIDTRGGDGVEACLTLDQRYFAELDKIQELRDLALIDPSPLENCQLLDKHC